MKIQFARPINLDGSQLVQELATAGVVVTGYPMIDSDGNFWLDIDPKNEAKAIPIVEAHVAVPYVDPDVAIKASGITHALSLGFTQAQAEAMFP